MMLNFYLNNYLFLSLARKEARPIRDALKKIPETTIHEQMGTFVRNHDELDLERLSEREREEVYKAFAPTFFPSPNRDHGYDIADYLNVDPRFGTLGHFVEFLDAAEERGIRTIIDLVLNHTSVDHPWFQEARKDKNSKYPKPISIEYFKREK